MRASLLAIVIGLTGCSVTASRTSSLQVTSVTQNVFVAWGQGLAQDQVRFDDPRLARAVAETAQLVGRPVEFYFNVAMMPRPTTWFFDALFERYIGRIPRDLERLRGHDVDVFDYGRGFLRQIHFDYDGSLRDVDITFSIDSGILRVRMGDSGNLVPTNTVSYAFENAYETMLRARFEGRDAEGVPPDQYRDYYRYLRDIGYRGDRGDRAAALRNAVVVWERTRGGPADVNALLTRWLAGEADFFRHEHSRRGDELRNLPSTDPFRAAERAYSSFVNGAWPSLDDEQRLDLLDEMFVRRSGPGREDDPFLREAFPGVDLFALSFDVIDRWIQGGSRRPYPVRSGDHTNRLYDFVVCAPREHDRRMYQRSRCDSELYRYASTDPSLRTRLFDEVLRRQSEPLTEALFANLKWLSSPYLLDAWRHFESDPQHWGIGTRVIAELIDYSRQDLRAELYDDSARLWRQRPELRGSILYLLASMDYPRSSRSGTVRWNDFSRVFGSLASRRDLQVFLNLGVGALIRVSVVVPALARGVNVADAIAPFLDRAMDDDALRRRYGYFPHRVLRDLVEQLRARGDRASLASLRRFFQARVARHPSEERALQTLIQMSR